MQVMMVGHCRRLIAATIAIATVSMIGSQAFGALKGAKNRYYLPDAKQSQTVSVSQTSEAQAEVIVMTRAVAINETGPKETVAKFGEVYEFAPSFIAVRIDEPTKLTFWNLQADDDHDFMLADPEYNVLMHIKLKPLTKTSYVFTFHKPGLFPFYCALHQPEMNGQILVLPKN